MGLDYLTSLFQWVIVFSGIILKLFVSYGNLVIILPQGLFEEVIEDQNKIFMEIMLGSP